MEISRESGPEEVSLNSVPLKHRVLAILSLAASKRRMRLPITAFYDIFATIVEQFPDMFPGLAINRTRHYAYSKQLDSALQELVGYSVDVPNPELQFVEIDPDAASRIIARLHERYSSALGSKLTPVVTVFTNKLDSISPR